MTKSPTLRLHSSGLAMNSVCHRARPNLDQDSFEALSYDRKNNTRAGFSETFSNSPRQTSATVRVYCLLHITVMALKPIHC